MSPVSFDQILILNPQLLDHDFCKFMQNARMQVCAFVIGGKITILGGIITWTSKSHPISPSAFRRAASFSARSTSVQLVARATTTYITANY